MTEHGGAAALKQNNLAALRSALYHTDFATKKELAEQCRLSLAACTALLGEMIDDGQVLELAFAASNGGRPARRFSINPNYAHILCLYTANNDVVSQKKYLQAASGSYFHSSEIQSHPDRSRCHSFFQRSVSRRHR